jgi:hypothetical protein
LKNHTKLNARIAATIRLKSKAVSTFTVLCLSLFLQITLTDNLFSQEIILSSIKEAKNDISAREHEFINANGDASAIIKTRIGLKDLDFSTDLGINKIEQRDGEVWLWVPPGTSRLSIITEKGDTITTKLPLALNEYSVCIVLFTLKLSPQSEYKELPVLSIKSSVRKTHVFINDIYQGLSPLSLSLYPDTFTYRVERKRYNTISGSEMMNAEGTRLDFDMKKSDTTNRFFLSVITDEVFKFQRNWGISIGMIGRTGWYFSYSRSLVNYTQEYDLDNDEPLFFSSYSLRPSDPIELKIDFSMLNLGIIIPVISGSPFFVSAGASWAKSYYFQYFDKIYYTSEFPNESILVNRKDKYLKATGLDVGIIIRINNQFLFSFNSSRFYDNISERDPITDVYTRYFKYTLTNYKIGIGYNF